VGLLSCLGLIGTVNGSTENGEVLELDEATTEANASLLIAAPDLLAALERLLELGDRANLFYSGGALKDHISSAETPLVFETVKGNGQIWCASRVPAMLANLAASLAQRGQLVQRDRLDMLSFGRDKSAPAAMYESLVTQLEALGIAVPPTEE
jgi:hypothetical protein